MRAFVGRRPVCLDGLLLVLTAAIGLCLWLPAVATADEEEGYQTTGTMRIDMGNAETTSRSVSIYSEVLSGPLWGGHPPWFMRIRNHRGLFGAWLRYSPAVAWTLSAGDGLKTVEVEYAWGIGAYNWPGAFRLSADILLRDSPSPSLEIYSSSHPSTGQWYASRDVDLSVLPSFDYDSITAAASFDDVSGDLAIERLWRSEELAIIDVSDPAAPAELSRVFVGSGKFDLDGQLLAISSYGHVSIVDLSAPATPREYATDLPAGELCLRATELFILSPHGHGSVLSVYDVTLPSAPVLLGSLELEGDFERGLAVGEDHAYFHLWGEDDRQIGLYTVNVADAASPRLVSVIPQMEGPFGAKVVCSPNYLVFAWNWAGVEAFDISDPGRPRSILWWPQPESGTGNDEILGVVLNEPFLSIGYLMDPRDGPEGGYEVYDLRTQDLAYHSSSTIGPVAEASSFLYTDRGIYQRADLRGVSYVLDRAPSTVPDDVSEGIACEMSFEDLADGVWYFHAKARYGESDWGPASHLKVQIDTTGPRTWARNPVVAGKDAEMRFTYRVSDVWSAAAGAVIEIRGKRHGVVQTIDLGRVPTGSWQTTRADLSLPAGSYRWCVRATDLAGNQEAATVEKQLRVR